MNNTIRSILAIVLGIVVGGMVNMFIVMKGSLPEGVNMENLSTNMHLFEAKHFVVPILGHAIGTLVGAFVASVIATAHRFKHALAIGVFYLFGGIANAYMLHFPFMAAVIDLIFAYIPMAYFAHFFSIKLRK